MTTRVTLSTGAYVDVKTPDEATNGDRKYILNSFASLDTEGSRAGIDSLVYEDLLLQRAIVGGSVPMPVTSEFLDELTLRDHKLIDAAVVVWASAISDSFRVDDAGDPDSPTPASTESVAGSSVEAPVVLSQPATPSSGGSSLTAS